VRKITVLVANQPRLMRELVMATLLDQPDLEIVGELEDEASIIGTVEQSRPDFLIVSLGGSGERPHLCDVLLDQFPHMRVLALAAESNNTAIYWANIDIRSTWIENSEESILSALRGKLKASAVPLENNSHAN
jgi:AmiR/NasT family two-component response regulator